MKTVQNIIILLTGVLTSFIIVEIALFYFFPQPYTYPRNRFSPEYHYDLYPGITMINRMGNRWAFHSVINELGYRGKAIPIQETYHKKNIVILGDSYSFGAGVDEGQQYPAILANNLSSHDIINLSVAGWGLTQEIRKFYEFGIRYLPSIVVLQFCSNDPSDNFTKKVAIIENGKFKFINSKKINQNILKISLGDSIVQKSQTYNLFRNVLYSLMQDRPIKHQGGAVNDSTTNNPNATSTTPEELFYCQLFDKFARDLHKRKIVFIVISVQGQLDEFPKIKSMVSNLHRESIITYLETKDWFDASKKHYQSPEGHAWGALAHKIIGEKLAEYIKKTHL